MDLKRNSKTVKKITATDTFSIKQKGGATFIEGFANKATVDRGNDIIATDAWELDNFKKNPIILFNHGMDTLGGTPVGRATQIKPTEEGLFLKVRLSNSEAPGIKMVRDLVEERILQAFSVGFDPKESEKAEAGEGEGRKEVNKITKAELFEVSIVGVPMNQDSLFTVTEKALKTKSLYEIKKDVLEQKGAKYAAELHEKLHELEEKGQDRGELIELISEAASISVDEVRDILAGNTKPSEDFIAAIDAAFRAGDMEDEETEETEEEDKQTSEDDEEMDEEDKDTTEETAKQEEDEDDEESMEESDEDEGDEDSDKDGEIEDDGLKDFQDCVAGKIPKLISEEGMEQDQAVAVAISQCQEGGKCTISPETKTEVFEACFAAVEHFKESGEWDFATLSNAGIVISNTESKQAEQEGQEVTQPIKTAPDENDFGSPFLEAQKQTNVMLGVLVSEIQKLNQAIEGLGQKTEESSDDTEPKDSESSADNENANEKTVKKAQKSLELLNKRLNNLGY